MNNRIGMNDVNLVLSRLNDSLATLGRLFGTGSEDASINYVDYFKLYKDANGLRLKDSKGEFFTGSLSKPEMHSHIQAMRNTAFVTKEMLTVVKKD